MNRCKALLWLRTLILFGVYISITYTCAWAAENSIVIDTIAFKSEARAHVIEINWHVDFAASLEYGYNVGTSPQIGAPSQAYPVTTANNTLRIALADSILFNTTYHVALWLRQTGGDWIQPTEQSRATVMTSNFDWEPVAYFKANSQQVAAFNSNVILHSDNWVIDVLKDTLDIFDPEVSTMEGFIKVGLGFSFRRKWDSPSFNIGIKYDKQSIPQGFSPSQIRIYERSGANWKVFPVSAIDTNTQVIVVRTDQIKNPFVLMLDTLRPTVTIGTMEDPVAPRSQIIDSVDINDNVDNIFVRVLCGKGGSALNAIRNDTLTATPSKISIQYPSDYIAEENGMRGWIIISDGVYRDSVNVSRRVRRPNSVEITTQANEWVPLHATAMLDEKKAQPVLQSLLKPGTAWKYDNTKFRLYRWFSYPGNQSSSSKWVEFDDDTKDSFDIVPGRLMWIKASSSSILDYGPGVTLSLTDTFEMTLPPKQWTDFGLPYKFSMFIGDILDATDDTHQHLHFYTWIAQNKKYSANSFYIPTIPDSTLNNRRALMGAEARNGFSVYNAHTAPIVLRIPPTPSVLSKVENPIPKRKKTESWVLKVASCTSDSVYLNNVICGFSPTIGTKMTFPVAPSFNNVGIRVSAPNDRAHYGHLLLGAPNKALSKAGKDKLDGYAYELVFYNESNVRQTLSTHIRGLEQLPSYMHAKLIDPSTGVVSDISDGFSIDLAPSENQQRVLAVGDANFAKKFGDDLKAMRFALVDAFPNPFKKLVTIRYTLPYTGIRTIQCEIFNMQGQTIWKQTIHTKGIRGGENRIVWNGSTRLGKKAAAGTYMMQLNAFDNKNNRIGTQKEILTLLP
jgi:hypothetical protein